MTQPIYKGSGSLQFLPYLQIQGQGLGKCQTCLAARVGVQGRGPGVAMSTVYEESKECIPYVLEVLTEHMSIPVQ